MFTPYKKYIFFLEKMQEKFKILVKILNYVNKIAENNNFACLLDIPGKENYCKLILRGAKAPLNISKSHYEYGEHTPYPLARVNSYFLAYNNDIVSIRHFEAISFLNSIL